jgi:hypothetical protein
VSLSNALVEAVSGSTVTISVPPDDPGYLGPELGLVTPGPGFSAAAVIVVIAGP